MKQHQDPPPLMRSLSLQKPLAPRVSSGSSRSPRRLPSVRRLTTRFSKALFFGGCSLSLKLSSVGMILKMQAPIADEFRTPSPPKPELGHACSLLRPWRSGKADSIAYAAGRVRVAFSEALRPLRAYAVWSQPVPEPRGPLAVWFQHPHGVSLAGGVRRGRSTAALPSRSAAALAVRVCFLAPHGG